MDKFIGKWEVTETENLDAILQALDLPGDMLHTPPMLEYQRSGDVWTLSVHMKGAPANHFSFTIGQPADATSIDGKPVKSVTNLEENKFVERYESGSHQSTVIRELVGDNELLVTVHCKGITSTAKHKRIT